MQASSTNESADSVSPNSSARSGHAAGRDRTAVGAAHVDVDVAIHVVVERARAAAGQREAGHRGDIRRPTGRPPAATNMPHSAVSKSSDMIRGLVSVR